MYCCTWTRLRATICGCFKRTAVLLTWQALGWAVFTYLEEDINPFHCFVDHGSILAKKATKDINRIAAVNELYVKIHDHLNGTHSLTNTSFEDIYDEFRKHFKVKDVHPVSNKAIIISTCKRWLGFTTVTLTTIGYGNVTPKSNAGKLILIPYAMIGIPIVMVVLSHVAKTLQAFVKCLIQFCSGKRMTKDERSEKMELETALILFTLLWIWIIAGAIEVKYRNDINLSFTDGIYFYFITYATIGYGDITRPIDYTDIGFGGPRLFIGLSLLAGILDSFVAFLERKNLMGRSQNDGIDDSCCLCCCCQKRSKFNSEATHKSEDEIYVIGKGVIYRVDKSGALANQPFH